jgi:MG2 domain-containing protein
MRRWDWYGLAAGLLVVWLVSRAHDVCQDTVLRYGVTVGQCPDGKLRQTARLAVDGVRRGAPGQVTLAATAHYTTHDADDAQTAPVPRISDIALALVDAKGTATPLATESGWDRLGALHEATIKLPDVPDGDYKLRATFATRLGPGEVELALPLYTPARVHVITDRPLYEPGNVVRFRAVALRARDLGPLDGRPGTWTIKNPDGEVLLEEKAPAGDWGVVSGTFPLDRGAPTGTWHVAWTSHDATDEVAFTVEPFTLPRFRVEVAPDRAFYRPGDAPKLAGKVVYSSGAPVAGAQLDITWTASGDWPPPTEWLATLLPKQAKAGANGRFELALPAIPADLVGTATLVAHVGAVDAAGDRVASAAQVLLSQDGIAAQAVTELGDGLVQGFNNRLYVRVTTPDGGVVANAKVTIKRAWQPGDNGTTTQLDEDGVASTQIDPGAPVNIVIPALPFRPAPPPAAITRGQSDELIGGQGASLADQVAMDRWLPLLAPCAKWVDGDARDVVVGLRVAAAGAIGTIATKPDPLERCFAQVLRTQRLPAGGERMLAVTFHVIDPELAKLVPAIESALDPPDEVTQGITDLARATRDCLPATGEGRLPSMLTWRVAAGAKQAELGAWLRDPQQSDASTTTAMACVNARIPAGTKIALHDPAPQDALGLVRFSVALPARVKQTMPQATTMLGYELLVSVGADTTKLRITPGQVPDVRMRVTPILAKVGDKVTAQLIRGPEFRGELPKELELTHLRGKPVKAKLDAEHAAVFTIAAGTEGWVEITGGGQRGLVYVRPEAELAVTIGAKQPRYAPGQRAELMIRTLLGGRGGRAAVGLFGVDDSLGQLVALPGPGELARVQPKVETSTPAFGTLDGQALAQGRIRGINAAAATVLRVSAVPKPPELDAVVSAKGETPFDAVEELTDRFYVVLAELHVQARGWEAKAPPAQKLTPPVLAKLWQQALAACEQRGDKVTDAYGRRLRLSLLPSDLLSLTDPREVAIVGTRLPEDIENWAQWVAKERP